MKYMKFAAVLLALVMAAGCSDKKKTDSSSEEIKGEPIETVSDETETKPYSGSSEYSESDFSEIPVSLTVNNGEAPINSIKIEIQPVLEMLGERMSPCKADDVWQQYAPNWSINGGEPQYDPYIDEVLKTPASAKIKMCAFGDNVLYFLVSFDDLCDNMHDWAICGYDMETEKYSEIFTYEGLESPISSPVGTMRYADGKLWFKCYNDDIHGYSLYSFDIESGSFEDAFDGKNGEIYEGYGIDNTIDAILNAGENRLVFADYSFDGNGVRTVNNEFRNGRAIKAVLYELDHDTGKFSEIFSNDNIYGDPVFCNGRIAYAYRNDKNKIAVHTENYTLTTKFRSADLVYADDKTVVLKQVDYNYSASEYDPTPDKALLFVYDLEKHTKLTFDVTKLGSQFIMTDGGIIIYQGTNFMEKLYYLIPESGMAFLLNMSDYSAESHGNVIISRTYTDFYIADTK